MATTSTNTNPPDAALRSPVADSPVYFRLVALWVLNEAMLGGIIHGFNIPVSGLVVGSCAIICICLIAWYVPKKGAILRATLIVAIFKMMLSPQSPPPAYVAVFFQGLLGELLFWKRRFFTLSCILLAVIGLLESGFQRILMLTIVYGNDLWTAINDFLNKLTRQKIVTNYSLWIGGAYVVLHIIAGIVAGWIAALLPARIAKWSAQEGNRVDVDASRELIVPTHRKKRKKLKASLFIIWIVLVLLYIQSYYGIGQPLLPSHISLKILLRSLIIILAWIFIVGPLLRKLLHVWLQKKRRERQPDIQQVLQLLPSTQQLIVACWQKAADQKVWRRMKRAAKLILVNALSPSPAARADVYILTGPVQTGKTTSLVNWSLGRKDVFGVLTPVVGGKRILMDAATKELFPMEAAMDEKETLTVGRFVFSKKAFDTAIRIIKENSGREGWLIIDEIGPMELRGEGFAEVVKTILKTSTTKTKLLLVVREGLVDEVKQYFGLQPVLITNSWRGEE